MTEPTPTGPPSALLDERVRRDLCATTRFNLAMASVWLADGQIAALVDALIARLDGEWRIRQLQTLPSAEASP